MTLMALWKNDPDILKIYKESAQSEVDPLLRHCAAKILALNWKDDPYTLPILKKRAQYDADETMLLISR